MTMEQQTMSKSFIITLIVVLLVIVGGVYYFGVKKGENNIEEQVVKALSQSEKQMAVERYIVDHLGELSVIGGVIPRGEITIVEIMFFDDGQTGTVTYFDGEKTYVGTFTYNVDEMGAVTISAFTSNELPEQKG